MAFHAPHGVLIVGELDGVADGVLDTGRHVRAAHPGGLVTGELGVERVRVLHGVFQTDQVDTVPVLQLLLRGAGVLVLLGPFLLVARDPTGGHDDLFHLLAQRGLPIECLLAERLDPLVERRLRLARPGPVRLVPSFGQGQVLGEAFPAARVLGRLLVGLGGFVGLPGAGSFRSCLHRSSCA